MCALIDTDALLKSIHFNQKNSFEKMLASKTQNAIDALLLQA